MKKTIILSSLAALFLVLGANGASASTVTRSFDNATPSVGSIVTVSLAVDVLAPDDFFIIDEVLPVGWTVTDPGSTPGLIGDTTQAGHIKWAILSGAVSTVLHYTVTVPATALGANVFSGGEFAFNSTPVPVAILGANTLTVPAGLATITVTPNPVTITGLSQQFIAAAADQLGNPFVTTFTWTSSNLALGTVDASGLLAVVGAGNTIITASSGAVSGTASATVQANLTAVSVTPAAHTMLVGQSMTFNAAAVDQFGNAMQPVITWTSSNPLVGTISQAGVFNSLVLGTVTITAASGAISNTAVINIVTDAPAVITILGDNPATVNLAGVYTDAGATALDLVDGDLTASIVTTGLPVDITTVGAKTVTYTVTDSIGNISAMSRTVNVVLPAGFDATLVLNTPNQWTLFSAPKSLSSIQINPADISGSILAFDGATQQFAQITDLNSPELLNPLNAFYVMPNKVSLIGFNFAPAGDPSLISKPLSNGWNLISVNNMGLVTNELSSIQVIENPQSTSPLAGLRTLFVPQTYNSRKSLFADWLANANIDLNANPIIGLPSLILSPYDGYWVNVSGSETLSKIK